MQGQKISFKLFTSRDLRKYKRLYYSREFDSTVNPMSSNNKDTKTYLIYGTMGTLSAVKRIHFRQQLMNMKGINNQSITFILFPILVSQSVMKFSQLSKMRYYLKGTTYLIKISPTKDSDNQQKILNEVNFILNKFQDFKSDNNEGLKFIPSYRLLPSPTGTKTPILYANIKNCVIQNKEPINQLIRLQIYYLINVIFSILFIIKLIIFVE